MTAGLARLAWDASTLYATWDDGRESAWDSLWLYDSRPEFRDTRSGQRLVDIADLPASPSIVSAVQEADVILAVTFAEDPVPARFPLSWLWERRSPSPYSEVLPAQWLWRAEDSHRFPCFTWEAFLASPPARRDWMRGLVAYGLAFLRQVPPVDRMVGEVAAHLGHIRVTNYGRIFDVRAEAQPSNLASSERGLPLHTDNAYREPVPGIQLLHFLKQSRNGGGSAFVDGFAVAEHLRATDPDAFAALTTTSVRFRYRDSGNDLSAERYLIQTNRYGSLQAIHYNNRSIQPVCLSLSETRRFYRAYRRFAELLRSPEFAWEVKLGNGDLVAFDNHRILHGRSGYNSASEQRHLQGCYLEKDGLFSALRLLEEQGTQ